MFMSCDDYGDARVEAPDGIVGTLIWATRQPPTALLSGDDRAGTPQTRCD
jgi:hypothetical protein